MAKPEGRSPTWTSLVTPSRLLPLMMEKLWSPKLATPTWLGGSKSCGPAMVRASRRIPLCCWRFNGPVKFGLVTMIDAIWVGAWAGTVTRSRVDETNCAAIGSNEPMRTWAPGANPLPEISMVASWSFLTLARLVSVTMGALARGWSWVTATAMERGCTEITDWWMMAAAGLVIIAPVSTIKTLGLALMEGPLI